MKPEEPIHERLARLAQAKFGSAHGYKKLLAAASTLTPGQVSKALLGRSEPTLPTIRKLARALGVSVLELADPSMVEEDSAVPVPVYGVVAAGAGEDEEFKPPQYINLPDKCRGADGAYIVRGLSMLDVGIVDGDYLFVRKHPEPEHGSIAVAHIRDNGSVVKRVEWKGDKRILHSADGKHDPRYPYTMGDGDWFIGRLVASLRTYDVKKPVPKVAKKK